MLRCLLKRVVPFVLTLTVGVLFGSLFRPASTPRTERQFVFTERSHRGCYRYRNSFNAPARIIYQPQPFYTEEARRNGVTGVVELRVRLDKDGSVTNIVPVRELPAGLTEEAIKAASRIQFTPATVGGLPVDSTQSVEFYFDGTESLRGEY